MLQKLCKALEACQIPYEVLDLDGGNQILVSQHGGHVFGPFGESCPDGLFWYPQEVTEEDSLRDFIKKRLWNTGGDRVWISPEIQFNITDRSRFRETLKQPAVMDPGYYSLMRRKNQVVLHQTLSLPSYNTVTGEMYFDFKRTVQNAPNPLRRAKDAQELLCGVTYCGYEQVLDLTAESEEDIFAESWNLLQIRPEGTLFIPMYEPTSGTDHYEPAGEMEEVIEKGVLLHITGQRRYKIAYPAAVLTGRFGYLSKTKEGLPYLLILNYPNNPSCMYAEEPPTMPGEKGYSIHIYNDDGNSGGFAEMECNLQTIGRPTGLNHSIDRVTKWMFFGEGKKLGQIAKRLLGYDFGL